MDERGAECPRAAVSSRLVGAEQSLRNSPSIIDLTESSTGAANTRLLRGGGTADSNTYRTVRRRT